MTIPLPTRDEINAGVQCVLDEDWVDPEKAEASGVHLAGRFAGLASAAFYKIQQDSTRATMWMLLWSAFTAGWCAAHLSSERRAEWCSRSAAGTASAAGSK